MKRLSQSRSSNFCPELRKNAFVISQSYFSNFALHMITKEMQNYTDLHSMTKLSGWLRYR